jgi:hypothetical protein
MHDEIFDHLGAAGHPFLIRGPAFASKNLGDAPSNLIPPHQLAHYLARFARRKEKPT